MLQEGNYRGVVVEAYLGFTYDGDAAACLVIGVRDAAGNPHKVEWQGGFEGEWLARTIRSLRNVGWTGDDLATLPTLLRRQVDISVKHKKARKGDKVYLQVFINAKKRMEPSAAAGFAERMKRVITSAGVDDAGDTPHEDDEPIPPDPTSGDDDGGPDFPPPSEMPAPDDDCPF